jgi:predicted DsbA family dithiol-disulfide isomerase
MSEQEAPVVIEMWTDLGCPWCYVGKHRLQAAIDRRPDAARFSLRLRSFELNPDAPREPETIERAFARSHGDASAVLEAEQRVKALAESEGLPFSLERLNANTFDVHRVLQHAEERGLGTAFFTTLQDRFFAGAVDPFDPDVLVHVARSVGLDGDRVREVLDGDEHADAVRADRRDGAALGLTGVPFVVVDRQLAAPGAQSVEVYGQMLDRVAGRAAEGATSRG